MTTGRPGLLPKLTIRDELGSWRCACWSVKVGDIGSAVAHRLFLSGRVVAVSDGEQPITRRSMAFADAIFDGRTTLDGVE